jgi:hypothetical protein
MLKNGSSPKTNASAVLKDHDAASDLGEHVQVREPMTLPLIVCRL